MTSDIGSERCPDWGTSDLGGVFSVKWIHKESLPFQVTYQVLNPWNENKRVQISRDGQVGNRLDRESKHFKHWLVKKNGFNELSEFDMG